MDIFDQAFLVERLGQEANCPCLQRSRTRIILRAGCDEDHRCAMSLLAKSHAALSLRALKANLNALSQGPSVFPEGRLETDAEA
jgi:hypothetical protein